MSSKKFEKEVEKSSNDLEEYTNLINKIHNQKIATHGKEKVMSDLAKEFALKPIEPMKSYFTINRWTKRAYLDWKKRQGD